MNKNKLLKLATAIAPELSDKPLYLLDAGSIPDLIPQPKGCLGYAFDFIHCKIKEHLEQIGQWQGDGRTIVLAYAALLQDYLACESEQWTFEDFQLATFLHELAHLVPASEPPKCEPTPAAVERQAREFAREPKQIPDLPSWVPCHGRNFVRSALHLHHRASKQGVAVPASEVCGGWHYDLSSGNAYQQALGDEPARLASASFAEIQAEPLPSAFTDLWIRDFHFFELLQTTRKARLARQQAKENKTCP